MTEANYSNNDYYHYAYDAVGNRKLQTTLIGGQPSTTNYEYNRANHLKFVNSVEYMWDDNGNLEFDGVNTYDYDSANRLVSLSNATTTVTYQYSGLGDRLKETVSGNPVITFTMDLNPSASLRAGSGLTQALSDGTNAYIYGNGRIAQAAGTGTEYFLGDALGSVRQLTNASGVITYTKTYDPYGVVTSMSGSSSTAYGYTNEYTSQGLVYLRARMYSAQSGRFLTRDSWMGDYNRPLSLNKWMYVEGNPINYTDPSGHYSVGMSQIISQALAQYTASSINISMLAAFNCGNCGPDGIFCNPTVSPEEVYNINFTESGTSWIAEDKTAAIEGVKAVARKFAGILGGSPAYAWFVTFGYMNFQMGGCNDCLGTDHAGYTKGAHYIQFAGMSDTSAIKRRNLVVHELGHAFKWLLYNKTGGAIDVYTELGTWRNTHSGYPDRQTFNGESGTTGKSYGFASLQNQIIWQQSLSGEDSEEFADQFLGWVFSKWETDRLGLLTSYGQARADMMNANMPSWVKRVAGR